MTLANDLVQFLMHLFGDRKAVQEFLDDPEKVLEDHGLGQICSADVDAAMPVVLDYAPVTVNARFDREYNTGGNDAATDHNDGGNHGGGHGGGGHGGGNNHGGDDHGHAVQQLHHVVNNYSYTSTVDDRDTITDQSANQNIWADGDVEQWFDNDSVVASGDRAIAAGDDVDVQDSNNIEDSYNTDNSTDNSTDHSIHAGRDASVGNTRVNDSYNTDLEVDVEDSFNDKSVEVTDNSDNSINTEVEIEDSFKTDNSETSTVEIEDSFQDNSTDVDIKDSLQDNSETTVVEDNITVAENELEFTADNSVNTDVEVDVEDSNVAGDDVNV